MKWITRERPKIDRIACPWLIARFSGSADTFHGGLARGFYNNMKTADTRFFRQMARNYPISDNYHEAIMGGTGANFIALVTGDAGFYNVSGVPMALSSWQNRSKYFPLSTERRSRHKYPGKLLQPLGRILGTSLSHFDPTPSSIPC